MTKNDPLKPTTPEPDLRRKQGRRKLLRNVGIAVVATALAAACTKSSDDDTKLGIRLDPKETHLTFTLPGIGPSDSHRGREAHTFRIPREYVDLGSVLTKSGKIYQLTVPFELPGPTPQQDRPWTERRQQLALKGRQDAWPRDRRFRAQLGASSGEGGRARLLHSIDPANQHGRKGLVRDGMAHGLVRYSPIHCYTPEQLKDPQNRAFLNLKAVDDPLPQANCRLARERSELVSPPEIVDEDRVVFVRCHELVCFLSFDFEGLGANVNCTREDLVHWPEVVNAARELLRGFIVREPSPHTPAGKHPAPER